jgi:hypothetical protein
MIFIWDCSHVAQGCAGGVAKGTSNMKGSLRLPFRARSSMCLVVSDQEQAALLLTIEGVHRRKQALAFDQPGPVIFIHIQDEDEIFG